MQHHFDISIAAKYDVNVAIFLSNMAHWIVYNQAHDKHFYDGRYWTFNSVRSFSILFPYWTNKQVRTIVNRCIQLELIVKGNYNKSTYDRTSWYTFTDKALELFNIPICPNGQINLGKRANEFAQNGKPIPLENTDRKEHISCSSDDEPLSKFDLFWKKYPRKQKKKRVSQIWVKKNLDKIADKIISSVENRINSDWKSKDLQYIPLPDSYLNQERWEDEIEVPAVTASNVRVSNNQDVQYEPCSNCKRPKLHCECNRSLASRETNLAAVAKLKQMIRGKILTS